VRNLVKKCVVNALCPYFGRLFTSRYILIIVGNTTNIFHRAHIVVWAKDLVKFAKRIWSGKNLFIVMNPVFGNSEPIFGNYFDKLLD